VSEKVWAQAIHAVTVQKMSLRRAAQLYGVHHMSLHRRVRGRYVSTSTARFADEFQLSRAEEDEVISVLREQFIHEHLVTSDDVRYVVRTIACQNGRRDIPSDFPQNRWIANFKRMYDFAKPSSAHEEQQQLARVNSMSSNNLNGGYGGASPYSSVSSPGDQDQAAEYNSPAPALQRNQAANPMYAASSSTVPAPSNHDRSSMASPTFNSLPQRPSRVSYLPPPPQPMVAMQMASNSNAISNGDDQRDDTSENDSEHNRESMEQVDRSAAEAKRCRQSNTVSDETWEKAMDAVEIHSMSLRNAAKAYGVHFAALHRRVKKRALRKESTPPLENYIPFEDEAGIVRVIHARADLGIIMSYEELVELLNRTALKYSPMITAELSRSLVRRFQSRVEQSIRHLIRDWPLPRLDSLCHFQSTPTTSFAAVVAAAAFAEEKMSSPVTPQSQLTQRAIPSMYVRNVEFANADSHRLSISDPFMSPMYRGDQESSSKAMLSPSGLQERLASPRGSVLRL